MLTGVKELLPIVLRRADALDVADVSFSASHGALLSSDGGLFTWGAASRCGELGHSSLQSVRLRFCHFMWDSQVRSRH